MTEEKNEVVVPEDEAILRRLQNIPKSMLDTVRKSVAFDATDAELTLFFYDCTRRGVHPLDRLIHFTKRKGRYVPVVGIDFMRSRAAGTGQYAGNDDAIFQYDEQQNLKSATVTVWRLVGGARYPFTATARWDEYKGTHFDKLTKKEELNETWREKKHVMLAKCAEALALRKAFPEPLGGLYLFEELGEQMPVSSAADHSPIAIPQAWPEEEGPIIPEDPPEPIADTPDPDAPGDAQEPVMAPTVPDYAIMRTVTAKKSGVCKLCNLTIESGSEYKLHPVTKEAYHAPDKCVGAPPV